MKCGQLFPTVCRIMHNRRTVFSGKTKEQIWMVKRYLLIVDLLITWLSVFLEMPDCVLASDVLLLLKLRLCWLWIEVNFNKSSWRAKRVSGGDMKIEPWNWVLYGIKQELLISSFSQNEILRFPISCVSSVVSGAAIRSWWYSFHVLSDVNECFRRIIDSGGSDLAPIVLYWSDYTILIGIV